MSDLAYRLGKLQAEVEILQQRVAKVNPCHNPSGSKGGQFCSLKGGGGVSRAKPAGKAPGGGALETADVKSSKNLGGGVSETRLVTLSDGSKAVFKPTSGEPKKQLHPNIKPGKATVREVAAGDVAKLGGVDDLVASSALRSVDGKPGVMIAFQKGTVGAKAKNFGKDNTDIHRAAVFDYVIGNQDRHPGNWVVNRGKLRLIDHDMAFPEGKKLRGAGINTLIQSEARITSFGAGSAKAISAAKFKSITAPYIANRQAILNKLQERGLPRASIRSVASRIDALVGKSDLTGMD